MPILQTYGGARGFGRGGLVPFVATGGNQVLTQNGWNYHLFTSSGTFTVVSGASTLQVLTINGGAAGQTSFVSGSIGFGGNGGSGGTGLFGPTSAPVGTSFAVTVAGAGGTSSVAPATSMTTVSGGGGGQSGAVNIAFNPSVNRNSIAGGSVALYNTRGVPWSLLSLSQAANSGGGGGAAWAFDDGSYGSALAPQSAGGSSGYSSNIAGPSGGAQSSAGGNAAANSGGGGGGGGLEVRSFYGGSVSPTTRAGGNGGSGFVIVAYPVA